MSLATSSNGFEPSVLELYGILMYCFPRHKTGFEPSSLEFNGILMYSDSRVIERGLNPEPSFLELNGIL